MCYYVFFKGWLRVYYGLDLLLSKLSKAQSNRKFREQNTLNSVPFPSIPNFRMGSSAELGMSWNDQFLLRNDGNHSESITRNFFRRKFCSQPKYYSSACCVPLPNFAVQSPYLLGIFGDFIFSIKEQ